MNWKKSPTAVLATLMLINVIGHIDRNMMVAFSPQLTRDLGLSNTQYGFVVGVAWVLSYGVMALVMGMLADRFSRPRLLAVGIFIWSVCTAASGMAHTFGQLFGARFFVASGEAALFPVAVTLLCELFPPQRRSLALGFFFMTAPIGLGSSLLLAGTLGTEHSWRTIFVTLGAIGAVLALPLFLLRENRGKHGVDVHGEPFVAQLRAVVKLLRRDPALSLTIVGFVLLNMAFVGLSFGQLWLVRERGFESGNIARTFGMLQIVFGALGAFGGGALSDRYARRLPGAQATVMLIMVVLAGPLMIAYRLVTPGSPIFYVGMCAGFCLPLATYSPANTFVQNRTPPQISSTITGITMLAVNILVYALGNFAAGKVSDALKLAGVTTPLTYVLLVTDILAVVSARFFFMAARHMRDVSQTGGVGLMGLRPEEGG